MLKTELINRINALFGNCPTRRIRLMHPAYRTDEVVHIAVQPICDLKAETRIHFMVTVIIPELVDAVLWGCFEVLKHTVFTMQSTSGNRARCYGPSYGAPCMQFSIQATLEEEFFLFAGEE